MHHRVLTIIALLALLTACHTSDDSPATGLSAPVTLLVPLSATASRIGDPGEAEEFKLPTISYFYLVSTNDEGEANVRCVSAELDPHKWAIDYSVGAIDLWRYTGEIKLILPGDAMAARVYAALADRPFDISPIAPKTEEQVRQLTFDIPAPNLAGHESPAQILQATAAQRREFLRNLYSSPAQLLNDNGEYYGTVADVDKRTPRLDLICYHVAARLDLMWNVEEAALPYKRISSISVTGLYHKSCALFMPTVNAAVDAADTYSQPIDINIGNQWYGRSSMYVIQRQAQPSFCIEVAINDGQPERIEAALQYDSDNPFTPWIRGSITIKATTQSAP